MSSIITDAKKIKAKALRLRDELHFDEAVGLLRTLEADLVQELEREKEERGTRRPELYELELALQLTHARGSIGGVFRRQAVRDADDEQQQKFLRQSIDAYDAGYTIENVYRSKNDSYTMVQRLVARVMLKPDAAGADEIVVNLRVRDELETAARAIRKQTELGAARENDEYAFGDLSIVLLLLSADDWRSEMQKFRAMPNADYAISGTREVLADIGIFATRLNASGRLAAGLTEALAILA